MTRKKKLIVGNWKMNPQTLEEAKTIFSKIKRTVSRLRKTEVVICPSDLHLATLAKLSGRSKLSLGVQNVFWEDQGFFTGQISPAMARNVGAKYALVGHSEKRKLGETNEQVALKLEAIVRDKLFGILCVGEQERDKDGNFFSELRGQITSSLARVPAEFVSSSLILAYEPVWEIGRADLKAMKPMEVHETSIFVRKILHDMYGRNIAETVPVLYGGSVSPDNAEAIVHDGAVDGLLVGRTSLNSADFTELLLNVDLHRGRR